MKSPLLRRLAWALLTLAAAAPVDALAANKDRHVVLISLDGFPAYLWRDQTLALPNLRRLAAEGAFGAVTGVLPSVNRANSVGLNAVPVKPISLTVPPAVVVPPRLMV